MGRPQSIIWSMTPVEGDWGGDPEWDLELLLWCHAIAKDLGDHATPEHSVFRSHDELCWGYDVLPRYTQTTHQILQSPTLLPLSSQILETIHAFSRHAPWKQAATDEVRQNYDVTDDVRVVVVVSEVSADWLEWRHRRAEGARRSDNWTRLHAVCRWNAAWHRGSCVLAPPGEPPNNIVVITFTLL